LELLPGFQRNPQDLRSLYIRPAAIASAGLVAGGTSSTSLSRGPTNAAAAAAATNNQTSVTAVPTVGVAAARRVPLGAFSRVEMNSVPITVSHQGQFPVVTLSFNLAPGASLGDGVKAVNRVKDAVGLPAGIQTSFQGTAAAFEAALSNEVILILAALVTVY